MKANIFFCFVVLLLLSVVTPASGQWTKHVIDGNLDGACGVYVADMDGDSDLDVVATAYSSDDAVWYEAPGWTKHVIDGNLDNPCNVSVADMDGDTDLDVVVTEFYPEAVLWFEAPSWTKHVLDGQHLECACGVYVADIDGDTDLDVVAGGCEGGVAWYEVSGWHLHIIDESIGAAGVYAADMDDDTDIDVVTAANKFVYWYEAPGWTKHVIDGNLSGCWDVYVADMDDDSDLDVVATGFAPNAVVWFEAPSWTKHVIDGNHSGAHIVSVADMDGDTDLDVVATGWDAKSVIWYEAPGWTKHVIDGNLDGACGVYVADMDGDSDLDVVATGWDADDVVWYEAPGGDQLPVAFIDGIYPNPAEEGEKVFFAGHGEDPDGSIVGHYWRSSIDGILSTQASFSTSDLSIGTHTIYLKVQDDDGTWSEEISEVLDISYYFVHLTDTHYGKRGARTAVNRLVNRIATWDPKPAFVIVTGDILDQGYDSGDIVPAWSRLIEAENNDYSVFKSDFDSFFAGNGIPYFVCPGNHDYYNCPYLTENLDKYDDYFSIRFASMVVENSLYIVSLNSGYDEWVYGAYWPYAPEGYGLDDPDINWMADRLDAIDGDPDNDRDNSSLKKVIMIHHPIINYNHWWNDGVMLRNREPFKSLCDSEHYDVDVVCSGHMHYNRTYDAAMDGSNSHCDKGGYERAWGSQGCSDAEFPLSTVNRTVYECTGAAFEGHYRILWVYSERIDVHRAGILENIIIATATGSPATLHLYDQTGEHVGRDETGEVDFEVEGATYSLEPMGETEETDPANWEHTEEEISMLCGSSDFRFEIKGTGSGTLSLLLRKNLTDGSRLTLLYDSLAVSENSMGKLHIHGVSVDYTIYMDDDGDGLVDREIRPDSVFSMDAPRRPTRPAGPSVGCTGVSYDYLTSTTDPENDELYYMFNWGDELQSGWFGPFNSGDVCTASHVWTEPGTYSLRSKAKDINDHTSDWSEALTVCIRLPFGSLYGTVSDSTEDLIGVNVGVYDSTGMLWRSLVTDDSGYYEVDSIPNGDYAATVTTPLGYHTDQETNEFTVFGDTVVVSFKMAKLCITPDQRGRGYWTHQVNALLSSRGTAHESLHDMCDYMELIRIHFNEHQLNPVHIFSIDLGSDCEERLEALRAVISPKPKSSMNDKAKAHLTTLLLNMVSGKIAQWAYISEDSATVSQAITYCNALIIDGEFDNDEMAKDIAEMINEGRVVPSEWIDLTTPEISYKGTVDQPLPEEYSLSQNYPNPFNATAEIKYALPEDCRVKLEIYNILGRKVASLVDGKQKAGYKTARWDAGSFSSGIYFCRLQAGGFVQTRKMVLLK